MSGKHALGVCQHQLSAMARRRGCGDACLSHLHQVSLERKPAQGGESDAWAGVSPLGYVILLLLPKLDAILKHNNDSYLIIVKAILSLCLCEVLPGQEAMPALQASCPSQLSPHEGPAPTSWAAGDEAAGGLGGPFPREPVGRAEAAQDPGLNSSFFLSR